MPIAKKRPSEEPMEPILADLFEEELAFDQPDDPKKVWADKKLAEYEAAPFKSKFHTRWLWRQAVINAVYGKCDPKRIPTEDLRLISHLTAEDWDLTKYSDKIKSPVTAVRAFCYNCQGQNISFVRNCTMSSCVLFPFRMGSNPFYGRVADADAEAVEDFPEEEIEQEKTTNGDTAQN